MSTYREQGGAPTDRALSLADEIKALEAQLAPEPTPQELEEREQRDKIAKLRAQVRKEKLQGIVTAEKTKAKGMYKVDGVDLDAEVELTDEIQSWFVVRGATSKETKAFDEANGTEDIAEKRRKIINLVQKCVLVPKVNSPESQARFEDAINRFGSALTTLVEKVLYLGGHRAKEERAFR